MTKDKHYRLLNLGEVVKKGDECTDIAGNNLWVKAISSVGMVVGAPSIKGLQFRRPLPQLPLKVGDVVCLSTFGVETYGNSKWQGGGGFGVVHSFPHCGLPVEVKWKTGYRNTYRQEHLKLLSTNSDEPDLCQDDEPEEI